MNTPFTVLLLLIGAQSEVGGFECPTEDDDYALLQDETCVKLAFAEDLTKGKVREINCYMF